MTAAEYARAIHAATAGRRAVIIEEARKDPDITLFDIMYLESISYPSVDEN